MVGRFRDLSSTLTNNYIHQLTLAFKTKVYEKFLRRRCTQMNTRARKFFEKSAAAGRNSRYVDGRWTQSIDQDNAVALFSRVYEDAIVCSRFYYQRTLVCVCVCLCWLLRVIVFASPAGCVGARLQFRVCALSFVLRTLFARAARVEPTSAR